MWSLSCSNDLTLCVCWNVLLREMSYSTQHIPVESKASFPIVDSCSSMSLLLSSPSLVAQCGQIFLEEGYFNRHMRLIYYGSLIIPFICGWVLQAKHCLILFATAYQSHRGHSHKDSPKDIFPRRIPAHNVFGKKSAKWCLVDIIL